MCIPPAASRGSIAKCPRHGHHSPGMETGHPPGLVVGHRRHMGAHRGYGIQEGSPVLDPQPVHRVRIVAAPYLGRMHPDWALKVPGREPVRGRNQLVLDFSREDVRSALKSKYAASQLFRSTGLACPAYFPLQIWFLISPWNIRESFPSPLSVCPRITSGSTSSSPGSSGYRKYSLCSPVT